MIFKSLFLILFLSTLNAETYKIDQENSKISFSVMHLVFSEAEGEFNKFSGTGKLDNGKLIEVKVEIDPSSIDTNEPERDEHLRKEDFFFVSEYPKLSFDSTKVELNDQSQPAVIVGDLTMRGVTRPVSFKVEDYRLDDTSARLVATSKIDRTKWEINYGPYFAVGKEVTIKVKIEASK